MLPICGGVRGIGDDMERFYIFWISAVSIMLALVILNILPVAENNEILDKNFVSDANFDNNNITLTIKQPEIEPWCLQQYLHRRSIQTINVEEDGLVIHYTLQEAKDMNYVQDGNQIYMDNVGEIGVLCGNYLYYGLRDYYKFCEDISDLNIRQECFNSSIYDLNNFTGYVPDFNGLNS